MKIIIAKRSGKDKVAYINANKINSFLADVNPNNGEMETKIYFSEGKCEIEGDQTQRIFHFMLSEEDSGFLDLVNGEKKSYWNKE